MPGSRPCWGTAFLRKRSWELSHPDDSFFGLFPNTEKESKMCPNLTKGDVLVRTECRVM